MNKRKTVTAFLAGVMAFALLISLFSGMIPKASALSSKEIQKQLDQLKQQRKDIQTYMDQIRDNVELNKGEIEDIIAKKAVLDQEIGILHSQVININEQISAYNLLIADKQDELDAALARYEELNEKNKERVRAMEEEGSLSYWNVLFRANSFADLLDRLSMIEEIASADKRRLKELSDAAHVVEAARDELQEEKDGQEEACADLEKAYQDIETKRDEAQNLIKELLDKGIEFELLLLEAEGEEESLITQIGDKENQYQDAKASEEAAYWESYWADYWATYVPPTTTAPPTVASAPTTAPSTTTTAPTESTATEPTTSPEPTSAPEPPTETTQPEKPTDPPAPSAYWMVPVSYRQFSSAFGERESPTAGATSFHNGVDLAAPEGTPIYASRSGTVASAYFSNTGGYMVTINHGDGFTSIYMHMTHFVVGAGQYVNQGQVIGYVGKTGIATGNHLHFGIKLNGAYVNPALYVAFY